MDSKQKKGGALDLLNTVSNYLANIKKFVYHILFSFLFFQGSKVTYSNPSFSACFQRDFHSHFHLFQTLSWENIVWILRNIYFWYCKKFFWGGHGDLLTFMIITKLLVLRRGVGEPKKPEMEKITLGKAQDKKNWRQQVFNQNETFSHKKIQKKSCLPSVFTGGREMMAPSSFQCFLR